MGLEDKLKNVLLESAKQPAKTRTGDKSLTRLIIDNWDAIQKNVAAGVTYKQIAVGMEVSYQYFMNSVYRAKKKIEDNPALIKRDDGRFIKANSEQNKTKDKQSGARLVGDFNFDSLSAHKER